MGSFYSNLPLLPQSMSEFLRPLLNWTALGDVIGVDHLETLAGAIQCGKRHGTHKKSKTWINGGLMGIIGD